MSKSDTAREHHSTARSELIQRIQLRDQVLMIFLGATATLFGIAFSISDKQEILLVVPYLTLGATVIVSQHQEVIGAIGSFLHLELGPFLRKEKEDAPGWDTSIALESYLSKAIWMRTIGHLVLLVVPSIAALALNWQYRVEPKAPKGMLWWSGLVFLVLSAAVIILSYLQRKRLQKSFEQTDHPGKSSGTRKVKRTTSKGRRGR